MKILLVMDCAEAFINGVSQSVLNLEKGLSDEGHDVRILMLSPDGKARISGNRYLTPSHNFSVIYPGMRYSLRLTRKLRDAVIAWGPDIIHSNTEGVLFFVASGLAKKTGAKHIHTFHTNFWDFYCLYFPFGKRFSQMLMAAYGNLCFRKTDGNITPSLWGKQMIDRFHFKAPHYILPNGIHTEIFSAEKSAAREAVRLRYGVQPDETLLLFVGRAATEKNIGELISCFGEIENPSVKLMITGGGPELPGLKKQAGTLNRENRILFTDMIPVEHIAEYYAAADAFVTASRSEIQPLTYVEAMASGLPVICADAPYIRGLVIPGVTGFVFHTKEEFSQCVNAIAEHVESRHTMGENAKARVLSQYSIKTFADSALRIYSEVREGRF